MRKIKGFTLIELMIVIVILGVLMSTVLPRLTGAQARGRDTGRVADLNNIAAALQVYYDDFGQYPTATADVSGGECLLTGDAGTTQAAISGYLKGNEIPGDPSAGANGLLCNGNEGQYWYKSLSRSGVNNNAFIICSDAETFQRANAIVDDATASPGFPTEFDETATTYEALANTIDPSGEQLTADATPATASVYCVLN